jgi:LPXTG-motif cell wall-anchored protein
MLHIDAGQIGTYEFPGADTPVAVNGQIVMVPVVVTVAAAQPTAQPAPAATQPPAAAEDSLTAGDQTISNNTVIVGMVVASKDGWVVIHESNADGTVKVPDIIGRVAVKAGMSHNLAIVLDKKVETGAKLWPMLHIDAGQIGTYEFPGADTPVAVNGQIVMQPIIVTNEEAVVISAPAPAPGMPSTGENDITVFIIVALVGISLLTVGLGARRRNFTR